MITAAVVVVDPLVALAAAALLSLELRADLCARAAAGCSATATITSRHWKSRAPADRRELRRDQGCRPAPRSAGTSGADRPTTRRRSRPRKRARRPLRQARSTLLECIVAAGLVAAALWIHGTAAADRWLPHLAFLGLRRLPAAARRAAGICGARPHPCGARRLRRHRRGFALRATPNCDATVRRSGGRVASDGRGKRFASSMCRIAIRRSAPAASAACRSRFAAGTLVGLRRAERRRQKHARRARSRTARRPTRDASKSTESRSTPATGTRGSTPSRMSRSRSRSWTPRSRRTSRSASPRTTSISSASSRQRVQRSSDQLHRRDAGRRRDGNRRKRRAAQRRAAPALRYRARALSARVAARRRRRHQRTRHVDRGRHHDAARRAARHSARSSSSPIARARSAAATLLFELDGGRLVGRKTLADLAIARTWNCAPMSKAAEDPFGERAPALLRARLHVLGWRLHGRKRRRGAARARRRGFRRHAEASARSATAPIHRAARAHDSPEDVARWPGAAAARSQRRRWACSAQPSTRAPSPSWTSPMSRALICVSNAMLRHRYHARYELVELAFLTLAARAQSLVPLHAACVGANGKGVLLMGGERDGQEHAEPARVGRRHAAALRRQRVRRARRACA